MPEQMHLRGVVFALGIGLSGCGGGGSSLQGPLAFTPNAVIAAVGTLPDGGIDSSLVAIGFANSSPAFVCQYLFGNFPDSGVVQDLLQIEIQTLNGPVAVGTFPINSSVVEGAPADGGQLVLLKVSTDPPFRPATWDRGLAAGVSGSITFTKVGSEYAGSFTAVVVQEDGGQSTLGGSFDTSVVCPGPN